MSLLSGYSPAPIDSQGNRDGIQYTCYLRVVRWLVVKVSEAYRHLPIEEDASYQARSHTDMAAV